MQPQLLAARLLRFSLGSERQFLDEELDRFSCDLPSDLLQKTAARKGLTNGYRSSLCDFADVVVCLDDALDASRWEGGLSSEDERFSPRASVKTHRFAFLWRHGERESVSKEREVVVKSESVAGLTSSSRRSVALSISQSNLLSHQSSHFPFLLSKTPTRRPDSAPSPLVSLSSSLQHCHTFSTGSHRCAGHCSTASDRRAEIEAG